MAYGLCSCIQKIRIMQAKSLIAHQSFLHSIQGQATHLLQVVILMSVSEGCQLPSVI